MLTPGQRDLIEVLADDTLRHFNHRCQRDPFPVWESTLPKPKRRWNLTHQDRVHLSLLAVVIGTFVAVVLSCLFIH